MKDQNQWPGFGPLPAVLLAPNQQVTKGTSLCTALTISIPTGTCVQYMSITKERNSLCFLPAICCRLKSIPFGTAVPESSLLTYTLMYLCSSLSSLAQGCYSITITMNSDTTYKTTFTGGWCCCHQKKKKAMPQSFA